LQILPLAVQPEDATIESLARFEETVKAGPGFLGRRLYKQSYFLPKILPKSDLPPAFASLISPCRSSLGSS